MGSSKLLDELMCFRAQSWVKSVGKQIRAQMESSLSVTEKTDARDLVTNVDVATEKFLVEKIRQYYPEHRIFGEESQSAGEGEKFNDLKGDIWIIDPIDGTSNFIKQRRDFAVMVGFYRDGVGIFGIVYDVMRNECFVGIRGEGAFLNGDLLEKPEAYDLKHSMVILDGRLFRQRNPLAFKIADDCMAVRAPGASSMSLSMLAHGGISLYLTDRQMPWDAAAPNVILKELGYVITRPDGSAHNLLEGEPYLIAQPALHQHILGLGVKFS